MVFHDRDVFVISRTWSITLIIVTNHKERGGFVYIHFSSTGPPFSGEVTYFNGRYLRVINPETKVDANNVTVIVRFQWLRHHTASQNFYLLVLLGTEMQCHGIDRWIILGVCVLFQVWCVGNCHMKWL